MNNGVLLNEKEIMKDVAKASDATKLSLGGSTANLGAAVAQAKALVSNIDMQYKVDIADNGWAEYITKEITNKNSDSIFWDLM